jgi:nitroimidazol reductase NimA-like FMN-containing flavoprotein (pyridoxamine 5'-phosphate oxidase superfamily)
MPEKKSDLGSPSGSATPGWRGNARRVVERIDEAECRELLSAARIGRLVYDSRFGLVALPFEYKMHEGSLVFVTYQSTFTEEDLRTGIANAEYRVAVEIDQVDPDAREGWMVLVSGTAHHVDTETELASIAGLGVESWIEDEPEHFIRVIPVHIGGQRIRQA